MTASSEVLTPATTPLTPGVPPNKPGKEVPVHRVEVSVRPDLADPAGEAARRALQAVGLEHVQDVRVVRVFFLEGRLSAADLDRAATGVLADAVLDRAATGTPVDAEATGRRVSVSRRSGVTDPEAESARLALAAAGVPVRRVKTARTYVVRTDASEEALLAATAKALGNEVIEEVTPGDLAAWRFPSPRPSRARRVTVPIAALDAAGLEALSKSMGLALSREEMTTIQAHFKALRRPPTDVELETLAQTWSEHCKHKTLAGAVRMRDPDGERTYGNVLKETVFAATRRLAKSWTWSVFEDNAGVIDFDGADGVSMKVETHNHPSAIEPYGGAGTGIGGVIRDILGTGLGARPVASTDVFCFGPPDLEPDEVPKGCLPPLRLLRGVVSGVRDYGNRMGIPTVNGAILFDRRYVGNPVVFCGCVGLIPKKAVRKAARPGDLVVAFGGRTGRDGIHGATFSSAELHAESETVSSGAVQIGDAITEKKVLDVLVQARDLGLFHAVTDCGAGGFSSAVGEMGSETGADVDLAAATLKYEGLTPAEIWISEAQERMVAAIPPSKWPRFRALCEAEDVEAFVLGRFTKDHRLRVRHGRTLVADLDMGFLHDGLPRTQREATWSPPEEREPAPGPVRSFDRELLDLLSTPEIGSKEWVIRQYDHEVQSGAVVRPLSGPDHGPSDAAVIAPKLGSRRGIVLANGIAPGFGDLDPRAMAFAVVDEAIRNAVAVGADPSRIALLDNFTWGDCRRPEVLGSLVRSAEGCRDAALLYECPFISGKDSLNNEFRGADGTVISVPPTLLVSAIGVIPDVRKTVTMDLKRPGDAVLVVGTTHDECGGGAWLRMRGVLGRRAPRVAPSAPDVLRAIAALVRAGLVRAAHDPSDGGLAVAGAEMAFAGPFGLRLDLARVPATTGSDERILFSESPTRMLLEVSPNALERVEGRLQSAGIPYGVAGRVTEEPLLVIRSRDGERDVVRTSTEALRSAWRDALGRHLDGDGRGASHR